METIIEVCAGSYSDCLTADKAGCKRVELNSALSVGGLTPTLGMLKKVKQDTDLSVICMIRPRAGGFCYSEEDVLVMFEDAKMLLENGADGLAFGFLNDDKTINEELTKRMVDLIHFHNKEAVFHRAFDVCIDPYSSIESLIECNVDRLLTSGQKSKAVDGIELIESLQSKYGKDIEILAGSGVDSGNAKRIIEETGISQLHFSCKSYKTDVTTTGEGVTYSYLKEPHHNDYAVVDYDLLCDLLKTVK